MRKIHTSYVEVPTERWLCASGGRCYRERGSVQLHRDGEVPGVHSLIVGSIRRTPVATIQGLSPRVCLTLRPKGQIAVADMSAAQMTVSLAVTMHPPGEDCRRSRRWFEVEANCGIQNFTDIP